MVGFHSTVGTLVLVGYLILVVVNVLALRGRSYPWARQLSFFAAGLLVLQYVIGFSLLWLVARLICRYSGSNA